LMAARQASAPVNTVSGVGPPSRPGAFAAPPRQTWIKLTVLPCRARIKLARADNK